MEIVINRTNLLQPMTYNIDMPQEKVEEVARVLRDEFAYEGELILSTSLGRGGVDLEYLERVALEFAVESHFDVEVPIGCAEGTYGSFLEQVSKAL